MEIRGGTVWGHSFLGAEDDTTYFYLENAGKAWEAERFASY